MLDGERALQENDSERAERLFRQAVAYGAKSGKNDWKLALAEGRLGRVLVNSGKSDEAKMVLSSSIDHFRAAGPGSSDRANLIAKERGEADSLLGILYVDSNDVNSARPYLEEASATLAPFWSQSKDDELRDTLSGIGYARALYGLAKIRQHDGDVDGALKNYQSALNVIDEERISVPLRENVAGALAQLLRSQGRLEKADRVEQKQDEYKKFNPGGPSAVARDAWREDYNKAHEAARNNEHAKADQYFAEAFKQVEKYDRDGEDALQTLLEWSRAKQKSGDSSGADGLLKRAEAMTLRKWGAGSLQYDNYRLAKNRVLKAQHKYDELEAALLEQVKLRESLRGKENFHVGETLKSLSWCRFRLNKLPEALADSKRAIAIFKRSPQRNVKELKDAYDELIPMLEKAGDAEEVRKYKFDRALLRRDILKWDAQQHRN